MANDFDLPPIYNPLTKLKIDYLSEEWVSFWATFFDNIRDYLSQYGILPPNLTTAQRDSIQSPRNGQMIYNVTLDTMQYYKISAGTWHSF